MNPAPGLVNDWFTPAFAWGLAIALLTLVLLAAERRARANRAARHAAKHRHPSGKGRCHMRSVGKPPCTYPGLYWVVDQNKEAARVCQAHRDEGLKLGWFIKDEPYDQELARLERMVNGDDTP